MGMIGLACVTQRRKRGGLFFSPIPGHPFPLPPRMLKAFRSIHKAPELQKKKILHHFGNKNNHSSFEGFESGLITRIRKLEVVPRGLDSFQIAL